MHKLTSETPPSLRKVSWQIQRKKLPSPLPTAATLTSDSQNSLSHLRMGPYGHTPASPLFLRLPCLCNGCIPLCPWANRQPSPLLWSLSALFLQASLPSTHSDCLKPQTTTHPLRGFLVSSNSACPQLHPSVSSWEPLLTTLFLCLASWPPNKQTEETHETVRRQQKLTRRSSSKTFLIFSLCFLFPHTGTTLTSLYLDCKRADLPQPPWGPIQHLPQHWVCSRHADLPSVFPHAPYPVITLHLHPWECQQLSRSGKLLQAHSKASSNVIALLQSALRPSQGCSLRSGHSTSQKSPFKSGQTTFLNTCCVTGTLCWDPKNIKITKTWTLFMDLTIQETDMHKNNQSTA